MSDITQLTNLGDKERKPVYTTPSPAMLEAFPRENKGSIVVGLDCLEFTSLCPMTGQPDFAKLYISYVPDRLCVETKSLKFYLTSYRNEGTFYEDLVEKIADDIQSVISAKYLRVYGIFNIRGGIIIKTLASRKPDSLSPADEEICLKQLADYDSLNG